MKALPLKDALGRLQCILNSSGGEFGPKDVWNGTTVFKSKLRVFPMSTPEQWQEPGIEGTMDEAGCRHNR